ncbi:hypothetical protein Tco_0011840 [Tanacetum coccineum]
MVVLESCPKHNMVAYLEKTDGNAEFHEIIDFLTRKLIHYALIIKKHVDLKTKNFDEIKTLYEKVKRFDDSFITIGSTKDERKIKEMNEGASDPDNKKKIVKEDVSVKVPAKQDVAEQGTKKRKGGHMKMIARKRKRPQPDVDSDDEHRKCLKIVTFEGTIDSEIMETKSFISKLEKYSESTSEGIELILWGDLKIMMKSIIEVTNQGDFWNDQQDWEIVTWRLYKACGVCILEFNDGTVIHMPVEKRYPLSKECSKESLIWIRNKSNPLIVDSLLKTIRLSIHLVVYNEELAIPEQTATEGKLKENQGCRVDTDQVHQNGDLKNRSVWIHPPDHNLWDVIVNGDLEEEPALTGETSASPAPKTAKQLAAKRNQERMLNHSGKQSNQGLEVPKTHKPIGVHGAPISKEDINQKFLRSLLPSGNQIALIMRNKPDIDEIDIDDLYNNLRVYEDEMKRSSSSTSTSQNLAFLSSENTSSTNEVSTVSGDFGVSTAGGISQVSSTPCAHDVACSFFRQPTTSPQLENEDF